MQVGNTEGIIMLALCRRICLEYLLMSEHCRSDIFDKDFQGATIDCGNYHFVALPFPEWAIEWDGTFRRESKPTSPSE